ncbi:hypothetical protein ABVV53_10785 [Novosphingobium sp. RD2P27]|uniref:Uncharacterized protein n=1 Tax=Novosphingobium kalidii TaxID=3230299 RepID=A0ABV2D266_9SPHN
MKKIATAIVSCAALAVSACGDETEPADAAVALPGGTVVTED